LEEAVDQGGFPVVDVGDDGDVAQLHGSSRVLRERSADPRPAPFMVSIFSDFAPQYHRRGLCRNLGGCTPAMPLRADARKHQARGSGSRGIRQGSARRKVGGAAAPPEDVAGNSCR
jgi:hypothetical protein